MRGRLFAPDPSGRHGYRMVSKGAWSPKVKDKRSGKTLEDPEGVALCTAIVPGTEQHIEQLKQRPQGVPQWEQKIMKATFGDTLEADLNRVGQYGWEVVSMSATTGTWTVTGNKIFALLKRPIPDAPPPPG